MTEKQNLTDSDVTSMGRMYEDIEACGLIKWDRVKRDGVRSDTL